MNTVVYVAQPSYVQKYNSIFEGSVRQVLIPIERAINIDTLFDFKFAEFLFLNNL